MKNEYGDEERYVLFRGYIMDDKYSTPSSKSIYYYWIKKTRCAVINSIKQNCKDWKEKLIKIDIIDGEDLSYIDTVFVQYREEILLDSKVMSRYVGENFINYLTS